MPERKFGPRIHHTDPDFEITSSDAAFDRQDDPRMMIDPISPQFVSPTEIAGFHLRKRKIVVQVGESQVLDSGSQFITFAEVTEDGKPTGRWREVKIGSGGNKCLYKGNLPRKKIPEEFRPGFFEQHFRIPD